MQTCDQLARRASQCCNNPASCMTGSQAQPGPAPGQGLNEYCQQMRAAGAINGQNNSSASGACYSAYNQCVNSCESLASGYSGQPAQMMMDAANSCRGYQAKVSQLANQGLNSQISGSSGDICNNVSQAQPQNMSGNQDPNNSQNNNMNPTGMGDTGNCQATPNTPACQAAAAAQQKANTGEASFAVAGESTSGKGAYNVNEPDMSGPSGIPGMADASSAGGGMRNGTIANNAGGGIPGGGGGGPASLNGGGRGGGGSPGSPGYTTDVMQGFQGGDGYSSPVTANVGGSEGGGYGRFPNGRNPAGLNNGKPGEDLSRFLPGRDKDPLRRKMGGFDIFSGQINGKFVNMWNRISERMQEKCRLGELLGCN